MPWKASSVMEERLRFVARLLDGEAMTDVCRDFGVSRKTGYKIFDRYKEYGLEALTDRSRRPVRYANQLPVQIESLIIRFKAEKPHWGARKIRELLVRRLDGDVRVPAKSTIHAVLDRHGLVKRGGGRRHRARGTPLSEGATPNELWCADFKGEFKLGNGRYCYPLTVTDHASRFLLLCEALDSTREDTACTAFERLFRERGLPLAIRSDNGVPFASPNALFNLSKLSRLRTAGRVETGVEASHSLESTLRYASKPSIYHPYRCHEDGNMPSNVQELRPKPPETEKITINLGYVDLGHVDLMVKDGFYSNRTDFIRTAIRNQLERHADVVKQSTARKGLDLGLRNYTRADLEAARQAGEMLHINVLGLASIAQDVTPDLARATIASVSVLGALHATPAVKAALADRTR